MNLEITETIRHRLIETRQNLHLTQTELSQKSKISERTIKYLESGKRTSFSETTLLMLCRALDIEYTELFPTDNNQQDVKSPEKIFRRLFLILFISILMTIFTSFYFVLNNKGEGKIRKDWVNEEEKLDPHHYTIDWKGGQGVQVNYYHLKHLAAPNEIIPIDLKWTYHFVPTSTPQYYVSAYTEWEPDDEIRLYDGVLEGDGSRNENFVVTTPKKTGIYRIRVFFASSFAPISSFYGHPPSNQLTSPHVAPYLEMQIEVVK